ncbi:hypothetical protein [Vampirovibrio sp.]|uniref:hypothetical protein n=1 Tax=Vampirovibrio sp. TaxID=2717857 RepID=UPI0035943528
MIHPQTVLSNGALPARFNQHGQSLLEYTIILGGVSLVVWGAIVVLGGSLSGQFNGISGELGDNSTNYLTRFNLETPANQNQPNKGAQKSGIALIGGLNMDFMNPTTHRHPPRKMQNAHLQSSTQLMLREANGGEMNVSSAEGNQRTVLQTIQQSSNVAQSLQKLAEITQNEHLKGLSHQALMSASVQATHQIVTDPANPMNPAIRDLAKATTSHYSSKELAASPERIRASIEQWNLSMETGKTVVMADQRLSADQKTQAVHLLDQVIQSTRQTYHLDNLATTRRNIKPLNDSKVVHQAETFTQIRSAAQKALTPELNNSTLRTTLDSGLTLDTVH